MKQTKQIALALTLCLPLLLTACNNAPTVADGSSGGESNAAYVANNAAERKTFHEIRESFENDVEAIKSKEYDNLNFDKASFSPPPQIDSISQLKLVELTGKSTDEIYDFFCETVDTLTSSKYTDEEKRYEIRFADGEVDESASYPYRWPNIDDYKNGQESDNPWPLLGDENYNIWMGSGVLLRFANGDLLDYCGGERNSEILRSYSLASEFSDHHILYTEDLTRTDTYRLVNGEISIADAAKFAQDYLDELAYTPYVDGNFPKPRIYAVNVFDIGGGCYGYDFMITYEYNSVWFDRYESKKGGMGWMGVKTDYDERHYGSWMGCIDMIRSDKIHRFEDISMIYDVVEGEPSTEIITVSSAADAVSEFFSGYMNFDVTEVSMVWLQTNEGGEPEQEAYPCWKFKMNVDGEIYHTFVDVITGEIHLYVQVV